MSRALVAQSTDDYDGLLVFASSSVKRRWRLHQWEKRQEHDPVWLGVQVLDTYEEMVGEGIRHDR